MSIENSTFIFKCNCSDRIGFGHISRSTVIANEIECLGFSTFFIIRDLKGSANKFTNALNNIYWLHSDNENRSTQSYWLECEELDDAEQTINVIKNVLEKTKDKIILVIDNYGVTKRWIDLVSNYVDYVVCLDDVPSRVLPVDVVVNYNPGIKPSDYYPYVNSKLIIGPEYSPLLKEYHEVSKVIKSQDLKNQRVDKILVFLGAGYQGKFLDVVVESISSNKLLNFEFTLLVNMEIFSTKIKVPDNLVIKNIGGDMIDLLLTHQIVIGSAGISSLERLCLGIPTLLVKIAENQSELYKFLTMGDYAVGMGNHDEISSLELIDELVSLIENPSIRLLIKRKSIDLIDGLGAKRLARKILSKINEDGKG